MLCHSFRKRGPRRSSLQHLRIFVCGVGEEWQRLRLLAQQDWIGLGFQLQLPGLGSLMFTGLVLIGYNKLPEIFPVDDFFHSSVGFGKSGGKFYSLIGFPFEFVCIKVFTPFFNIVDLLAPLIAPYWNHPFCSPRKAFFTWICCFLTTKFGRLFEKWLKKPVWSKCTLSLNWITSGADGLELNRFVEIGGWRLYLFLKCSSIFQK